MASLKFTNSHVDLGGIRMALETGIPGVQVLSTRLACIKNLLHLELSTLQRSDQSTTSFLRLKSAPRTSPVFVLKPECEMAFVSHVLVPWTSLAVSFENS